MARSASVYFDNRADAVSYLARKGWIQDVKEKWYLPLRVGDREMVRPGILEQQGRGFVLVTGKRVPRPVAF